MIACFENLVGIRTQCGTQAPSDSGLYIQDLPFINIKLADAIVSDQDSGVAVLQECYSRAVNYMENELRTNMMPYFKKPSVVENNVVGFYAFAMNEIPALSGYYKGIQMQVRQYPYLKLFLPQITLFMNYTGTVDVEVWDLSTGVLLDTIEVEAVAGQKVIVNTYKSYQSNGQTLNLFIGYNSTGKPSYQSNIYNSVLPGFAPGSCRTCYNTPFNQFGSRYVWLFSQKLPVAGAKVQNNLSSSNDCGGLSVSYTLDCSIDPWLCTMRDKVAFGLLHRWGMEILREVEMSNRVNSLVTLHRNEKENLYEYFEQEYKKNVTNFTRNLQLPRDLCFKCNSHISAGIAMP